MVLHITNKTPSVKNNIAKLKNKGQRNKGIKMKSRFLRSAFQARIKETA